MDEVLEIVLGMPVKNKRRVNSKSAKKKEVA